MRYLFISLLMIFIAAAAPAAAKVIQIEINGLNFSPAKVSARVGDKVEWTNKDFVAHTATAKSGEWNNKLPVKGYGSVVLKKAGHIDYYCIYHPTMKGEIEVSP